METQSPFEELREIVVFSDKEIFTKIWTSPKKVFTYVVDNGYDKYATYILILVSVLGSFNNAIAKSLGGDMNLFALTLLSVFVGGLFGYFSYYIYAALLSWTGNMLGGEAGTGSIIDIVAYAMIPAIIAALLLTIQIILFGTEIFETYGEFSQWELIGKTILSGTSFAQAILNTWSLVLLVVGLSVAQNFSIGKAILNVIMPFLVIGLPIILLVWIFT